MAWLDLPPSGTYQIAFRFAGRKFKRSLETTNPQQAERARLRLEDNLRLVEQGRLDIPDGVDVAEYLLYDGKLTFAARTAATAPHNDVSTVEPCFFVDYAGEDTVRAKNESSSANYAHRANGNTAGVIAMSLGEVFDAYLKQLPSGALAEETLRVANIHFGHLKEILGADTPMLTIEHERLQDYVNKRSESKGRRGRSLSATTIKKELGTLSSVWTFAKGRFVAIDFPGKKLSYPMTSDKAEFQTIAEVERKIALGHLSPEEEEDLWDCVFLTLPEIDELLRHVRRRALHPFLYPMFVFAAHTGARRSEIRRSEIQDLDFEERRIIIRERKRVHGKHTRRSVPMSPQLETVLRDWLVVHPGGRYTFCLGRSVAKSRKTRAESTPLTCEEAGHHFQQVLLGTKWERLRGWHAFRHSFCSNAAASGIPQRIINRWVGHTTREMVQRYQHRLPSQERAAMKQLFSEVEADQVAGAVT